MIATKFTAYNKRFFCVLLTKLKYYDKIESKHIESTFTGELK
jgi:hypothetical protein